MTSYRSQVIQVIPPTLHRLLLHSAAVSEELALPIGAMSEEAGEATHKEIRLFRLQHTRKDSRAHTMSDLFGRLLVSSDPLLSSMRQEERRQERSRRLGPLSPEVFALLRRSVDEELSNSSSDEE